MTVIANEVREQPLVPVAPTPAELLRIAVSQNADIEKLKQLMDLQERWEKNEARKAFVSAMNAFKANPPEITKNKAVSFGTTKYSHATLDHVCDAVTKGLGQHGISHRWKVEQDKEWITVTCILTHEMGHFEETKLLGAPDNSGSKNSIQAIGSTVTYLQRYTLLAATGLAAANGDNDGKGSPSSGLSEERFVALMDWVKGAGDIDELQKQYFAANKEALAAKDQAAQKSFYEAKNNRYRELANVR